jgi:hypothetical protein
VSSERLARSELKQIQEKLDAAAQAKAERAAQAEGPDKEEAATMLYGSPRAGSTSGTAVQEAQGSESYQEAAGTYSMDSSVEDDMTDQSNDDLKPAGGPLWPFPPPDVHTFPIESPFFGGHLTNPRGNPYIGTSVHSLSNPQSLAASNKSARDALVGTQRDSTSPEDDDRPRRKRNDSNYGSCRIHMRLQGTTDDGSPVTERRQQDIHILSSLKAQIEKTVEGTEELEEDISGVEGNQHVSPGHGTKTLSVFLFGVQGHLVQQAADVVETPMRLRLSGRIVVRPNSLKSNSHPITLVFQHLFLW